MPNTHHDAIINYGDIMNSFIKSTVSQGAIKRNGDQKELEGKLEGPLVITPVN